MDENRRKARTDALAADLLDFDQDKMVGYADSIVGRILRVEPNRDRWRIVLTGGAGSGKTSLASELSKQLGIPVKDFDEYIEGGWVDDEVKYSARFRDALAKLWDDMPSRGGWIIEHVEACHPDMIRTFDPRFAVLLIPGELRLKLTAEARNLVSGQTGGDRERRALQSDVIAKNQFTKLESKGNPTVVRISASIHMLELPES